MKEDNNMKKSLLKLIFNLLILIFAFADIMFWILTIMAVIDKTEIGTLAVFITFDILILILFISTYKTKKKYCDNKAPQQDDIKEKASFKTEDIFMRKNKNLRGNILVRCKTSPYTFIKYCIPLLFFLLVCIGLEYAFALIMWFVVAVIVVVDVYLRCTVDEIILTDEMLYIHKGLLNTTDISTPIDRIQNIEIQSDIWGKMFKYSKISIDSQSKVYEMNGVSNANLLSDAFYQLKKG